MSLAIQNYKGYPILSPDPTSGTPARQINDAIKGLVDTSVQALGYFPATNFDGAFAHFRQNYGGSNSAGFYWITAAPPAYGGLFPAAASSNEMAYNGCRPREVFSVGCNVTECGGCYPQDAGVPFVLCAVNPSCITTFRVNLLDFVLRPVGLQSLTGLTTLGLQHFTLTNDNLIVANLNNLTELSLHFVLSGSSTVSINNLPSLTALWMSGSSYGGMQGLTDANFTLDISTLPDLTYVALYNVGTGLSSTWIDNVFIALAASVVSNPRTGFFDIGGETNSVTSASAAARTYLSGPGGWTLTYNS